MKHTLYWLRNHRLMARASMIIATLAAIGGLGALAVAPTNAYFTDSHDSNITGTIGNVHIEIAGGGTNNEFSFDGLLPGESATATVTYTNTGSGPEDVWLAFRNLTALSALNTLGTYGEVHVSNNGVPIFDSANLNDRSSTCGPFSPSGCWPLPSKLLLVQNLAPHATGSVTFTFKFASKMTTQPAAGVTPPWNPYPIDGQVTKKDSDGTGAGLPRTIVATQHGQQP